MKPYGEVLRLERDGWADRGMAGLVRTVLKGRPGGGEEPDSDEPSLLSKLNDWLYADNPPKTLSLSLDDVEVCAKIIKSQAEIADESPGINEPHGTSTPQNISQARTLLPKMKEFLQANGVEVDQISESPVSQAADYNEEDGREHSQPEGDRGEVSSKA